MALTRPSPEWLALDNQHGQGTPDPRALALVVELQARLPNAEVVLFGSRAMGNWVPESDLDLAVIGGDRDAAEEALAHLCAFCKVTYGRQNPYAQLFHFTRTEFERLRTSLPHVAGQIQRHGLKPNGKHMDTMEQNRPWDGVKTLLQNCRRKLNDALQAWGSENHINALFSAHGAVEVAIKAALGASGIDITDTGLRRERLKHHRLVELGNRLPAYQQSQLNALLPPSQMRELTAFRSESPYEGEYPTMPTTSPHILLGGVQKASLMLATYSLTTLGKLARDVGYAEWVGDDALAGFGTVALDHFSQSEIEARAERRAMITVLRGVLTDQQLEQIEQAWLHQRIPTDAVERALTVRDNPSLWQTLLALPDDHLSADNCATDTDIPPPT